VTVTLSLPALSNLAKENEAPVSQTLPRLSSTSLVEDVNMEEVADFGVLDVSAGVDFAYRTMLDDASDQTQYGNNEANSFAFELENLFSKIA